MPADALPSAPSAPSAIMASGPVGALRLLAAFRREQADPDSFYGLLARDSVALVARHARLDGSRVVDVGGGAGYFADAFRERGAQCLLIEPDPGRPQPRERDRRRLLAAAGRGQRRCVLLLQRA